MSKKRKKKSSANLKLKATEYDCVGVYTEMASVGTSFSRSCEDSQVSVFLCAICGIKAIEDVNDRTIIKTIIVLEIHMYFAMLYAVFTISHKCK